MCVGTVRVENEGGTWLGRVEGFDTPSSMHDLTLFEGQGDYAGLRALRIVSASPTGHVEEGVIFDFEMPEQPEPPAE